MEWRPYSSYGGAFVEITKADSGHGGPGWDFGTCLWSPTRNRAGHDRYSIMRRPERGDLVLHFYAQAWPGGGYESRLAGRSEVAAPHAVVDDEPPSPGDWAGMAPYYRIDLTGFEPFEPALPLRTIVEEYGDEIRGDIISTHARFYPFATHGSAIRTVQGIYLAAATPGLYGVFRRALGLEEAATGEGGDATGVHEEYVESRRLSRERYYFARNPGLVKQRRRTMATRARFAASTLKHATERSVISTSSATTSFRCRSALRKSSWTEWPAAWRMSRSYARTAIACCIGSVLRSGSMS